jgi:hypothetical protein
LLCTALNIHDSGVGNLAYKLEHEGSVVKRIDPRNPLNKWPPAAWQQLNSAVQAFFRVHFAKGLLTVSTV